MVVFKQDTTSVSTICDWTNQTLRQFRPSVSRACEACNRRAYFQACLRYSSRPRTFIALRLATASDLSGDGNMLLQRFFISFYISFGMGLIFPMERISGSLALAISEHRLGDALYALLLSRHAKEP